MEYLIPVALVVLVVTGFVTFLSFYSMKKGGPAEVDRNADDADDASPGMGADDDTALGDSDQLAQERPSGQSTEHESSGATDDHSSSRSGRFTREEPASRDTRPDSERLADRSS